MQTCVQSYHVHLRLVYCTCCMQPMCLQVTPQQAIFTVNKHPKYKQIYKTFEYGTVMEKEIEINS